MTASPASPPLPPAAPTTGDDLLPWLSLAGDLLLGLAGLLLAFQIWTLAKARLDLAPHAKALRCLAILAAVAGTAWIFALVGDWRGAPTLAMLAKPLAAGAWLAAVALAGRPLMASRASPAAAVATTESSLNSAPPRDSLPPDAVAWRKLALAVEHGAGMVVITDASGRVEYCNPAFCRVTGYTAQEVLGRRMTILKTEETDPNLLREFEDSLVRRKPWRGEVLERKKNGELFWCLKCVAPIPDRNGQVRHFVAFSHDVTGSKESEKVLRQLAYYDPLTRLPNRSLFRELLQQTQRYAKQEGARFAVIHLDLDRFKNINESLGHFAGDQVLLAVSLRLRQCLPEEATVARFSGDKFILLLPGLEHPRMAGAAATAILDGLAQPLEIERRELYLTASMGISVYPDDHADADELLKLAESAMYQAKKLGRNQFQYCNEAPEGLPIEQLSLETWLRFAVERGELEIHYQPKFELATERCYCAEALLRWQHPEMGRVSPGRFIPIAEETGLIDPIGEWLLREVCLQIKRWQAVGLDLTVAVNLSARQFRQKNLVERIDAIIDETGTDRARLEFEITESAVMSDPKQTAAILHALKDRGLALSIDDFGTGYSSLSYLKMFPVDILKIDQSFVRDLGTPAGDPRIVRAIVALAHSLELEVVAEGVETRQQADFLKGLRCDLAQGFFFSRPLPAAEVTELLRARARARAEAPGQRVVTAG